MLFRDGFVTNSSSTNFLIISKKNLTPEYLFDRLGFVKDSPLEEYGRELCRDIIDGIDRGTLRWFDISEINFESVKEVFGEKSARLYADKIKKGFHAYMGYTSSDQGMLTVLFTTDYMEIEEEDFYLNGLNCTW
ncbi:MAG: hypothetical protein LBJ14_08510 [Desulfarculales bacterium]|jgi:hypothetical protein|nr:hypothetical protein [Desulfarculales bacterium]